MKISVFKSYFTFISCLNTQHLDHFLIFEIHHSVFGGTFPPPLPSVVFARWRALAPLKTEGSPVCDDLLDLFLKGCFCRLGIVETWRPSLGGVVRSDFISALVYKRLALS